MKTIRLSTIIFVALINSFAFLYIIYYRFANAHLTETQLYCANLWLIPLLLVSLLVIAWANRI